MSTLDDLKLGDRVRLVQRLSNGPTSSVPIEVGVSVGTEGTVNWLGGSARQVGVHWDNGSNLMLLDIDDGRWERIS